MYHDQKRFIESLTLKNGETWRGTCDFCNGDNTLSATNVHGTLLWYCFKASCDASGSSKGDLSKYDIQHIIGNRDKDQTTQIVQSLPDHFQFILDTGIETEMMKWLYKYQLWQMAKRKLLDVRYDPKMCRVVLIHSKHNVPVNAIGFSLNQYIKPKWFKYLYSPVPFIIDPGSTTCVIVEDVPSAAVVAAAGLAGAALMGTTWLTVYRSYLLKYDYIIVALDLDATKKALEIQTDLKFFVPTAIRRLEVDLKHLAPKDIVNYLNVSQLFAK